jgi:Uma2 family endonuclease
MGEPLAKRQYYTKEEYLEAEALAEYKSEYYSGEIFAMAGGSPNHSIICFNLCRHIGNAISDKNCTGFESNMKLEIAEAEAYVYPDAMVVCGDTGDFENSADVITDPVLIIEVLSPSTELFDRGKKFQYYLTIPSLREYVLVSQDKPKAELFFKQNDNIWQYTVTEGLDKTVVFKSLECGIALKDIYHKVAISHQS